MYSGAFRILRPNRWVQRLLHSRKLIFNGNQHQYNTRYDLTKDGQVKWAAGTGGHSHGWYSLSGAMFSMKGMKPLAQQYVEAMC